MKNLFFGGVKFLCVLSPLSPLLCQFRPIKTLEYILKKCHSVEKSRELLYLRYFFLSGISSDVPLFRFRPEFPVAGARMTDSFRFEHFIIHSFFFSIEIKSFGIFKKLWCNNILHNSSFGATRDWMDFLTGSSLNYNMNARYEWCERHEWIILILIMTRAENIFNTSIFTIW